MQIKIKNATAKRIKQGYRLLSMEDINEHPTQLNALEEGEIVNLVSDKGEFCGRMLIGRQNKGLGWIFTEEKSVNWNVDFVFERIENAISKREKMFDHQLTNAYRLFNGEGDGIGGVTIDYYDGFLQFNWYSKGIYAFQDWFISAVIRLIPDLKGIYETQRFNHDTSEAIQHIYGDTATQPLVIIENGVKYAVYLGNEWMTGIFMDQREVRSFIKQQTQGMTVLNLFSYTGAFSIAATVGGAVRTVSVDVANRSLDRTEENFSLNEIDSNQHEIRVMDVFDYVQYAQRHQLQFDCVVCDPPSFARTKKYTFSAEKDYKNLAKQLLNITSPGGLLILSTNHSVYSKDKFLSDVLNAMHSTECEVQLIQSYMQPQDYPFTKDMTSQYLKVFVFYRVK